MRVILMLLALVTMSFQAPQGVNQSPTNGFNPTANWQVFAVHNGVNVEYKKETVEYQGRFSDLVFFKFTNTTNSDLTIEFKRSYSMNNKCWNCNSINSGEHTYTVDVAANSSVEGSSTNLDNALYIFSKYKKLVPGMSDLELTNVEFIDVEVK